ncbi:MAG: replication restart helicase PriA [Rhabdochlamydiaceae bacterium]
MSIVPEYVSVILDDLFDRALDYRITLEQSAHIKVGSRVLVPVRNKQKKGTVVQLKKEAEVPNPFFVSELLQEKPFISEELMILCEWLSRYYCTSLRKVIKIILPPIIRKDGKSKIQLFVKPLISKTELADILSKRKSPAQNKILDVILSHPKGLLLSQLLEKAQTSRSPVDQLVKDNILSLSFLEIDRSLGKNIEYFKTKAKALNGEQEETLRKIVRGLDSQTYQTHLIFGVTGSGKTEIYLQAIEHALKLNKSSILLVPEISLTSQTIDRLRGRFEEKIAILHHRLSEGEKFDTWQHIKEGRAKIVVGARSAIFSPVDDLGLIIVDEEHEPSYKQQEEAPCYHARDVAVMRGKINKAQVILGSATPSLESFYNTQIGKYSLSLLTKRASHSATLPLVHIVDMKHEWDKQKGFTLFSDLLLKGIKKRITQGEQVLLFLNKRGYHRSQVCQKCGFTAQCPHCSTHLTFHLSDQLLACHLCDYRSIPLRSCPDCQCDQGLKYKGAGTELVEKTLYKLFPSIKTLRLDADTTKHKGSHESILRQFKANKADVLIGTQMIAKGLDFPSVTLVGVLNADAGLHLPDFRASENLFQIVTQVTGRSGRSHLAGEAIIQTHLPSHPLILQAANQDFISFYKDEILVRESFQFPPFHHLIKVVFVSEAEDECLSAAKKGRAFLVSALSVNSQIHPVVPSGHAKIKDKFRFQFLIKVKSVAPFSSLLRDFKQKFESKKTRILIDVDPQSTFF